MYIAPNSVIKLYHNVPLDETYNHTLFFQTVTQQNTYFHAPTSSILKYALTAQSYQRVVKGSMRVAVNAENLYDCNYLAFQNTAFGSKWFYAFITGVEYVNNETSEVTFKIDVMQTYLYDVTLKPCLVEREHSSTDVAGDNIQTENIDIGDITCEAVTGTNFFDDYIVVVCTASTPNGQATGGYYGGLFSGCDYKKAPVNDPYEVALLLDYLKAMVDANDQDSVVSIFLMPAEFYPDDETPTMPAVQVARVAKPTQIHGYTPRNKKLLTYPFSYLNVDCGNNGATFRYEWFNSYYCDFEMVCGLSCNPQIALVPQNYNGVNYEDFNYVEKLVMDGFPQVAWCVDAFRAWLAQEATGTALQGLASIASIGAGAIGENPMAIAGGTFGLANVINSVMLAHNRPNQARGANTGSVDVAMRTKNFYFRKMCVSPMYARIIDEFFDMYGYATMRVKVPNRSVRPHWNYVKTRGCVLIGNAPADDVKAIAQIYDKGITFWNNPSEVGDYSLDNSIQ